MGAKETVENSYDIDEDTLYDKSESSEFWANSYRFYVGIKKKVVDSLSDRQLDWLEKIEASLDN